VEPFINDGTRTFCSIDSRSNSIYTVQSRSRPHGIRQKLAPLPIIRSKFKTRYSNIAPTVHADNFKVCKVTYAANTDCTDVPRDLREKRHWQFQQVHKWQFCASLWPRITSNILTRPIPERIVDSGSVPLSTCSLVLQTVSQCGKQQEILRKMYVTIF
jgi:hypothetical protein